MQVICGVHERSRTSGPTLRRRVLYPTELRTQVYELLSNRAKAPNAFIVYQIREQNANVFLKNLMSYSNLHSNLPGTYHFEKAALRSEAYAHR